MFSQVKNLQAIKTIRPPVIDGVLDDTAWKSAAIARDFIQNFPNVGRAATQRTEVRILYDNSAIYISARLFDDPKLIRSQLTARDEEQFKDLDFFSVFIDTYHDTQNGFQFLVTSSNVQTDAKLGPNVTLTDGSMGDKTWDAVWESKVSIVKDGWVVEMKIPYLSLRFARKNVQDWGIQFLRLVRRTNERSYWNAVDPNVNGFVNQFGLVSNLRDIKPPLRLSFSPYISTGMRNTPEIDQTYNHEWLKSGGMDVKYGLNESFTLDATLIPDFGQVISDNVVNNLTPYEVQLDDNRPFFTEGTELFEKSGLFYSRRIGATPALYDSVKYLPRDNPDKEILKNPGRTELYNAIKFSGRTPGKLGIGFFNAIAAPMYASIRDKTTSVRERVKTETLTNYNIFVLDQALKGRSYVTFTNTNVIRNASGRDANVTGLDFSLYDKINTFNVRGYAHYSQVYTKPGDYHGYNTSLRVGKVSGQLQYYFQNIIRSDQYDPTDLGYLQIANQQVNMASISYNQFEPTTTFINYKYSLTTQYARIFRPDRFNSVTLEATGSWVLNNFWAAALTAGYQPDQHDYYVFGAPFDAYARRPQYGYLTASGNTDDRKRFLFGWEVLVSDFFKNPEKKYYTLAGSFRYRFSDQFSLDLSHSYETETDYIVSAGRVMGAPQIAFVDFREVTSILSGIYNFTSRINLTLRVRHYWSHVPYKRVALVDSRGLPIMSVFTTQPPENINYFNADAFLTWDFQYGSRLIIGYKNWLGDDEYVDGNAHSKYLSNLGQSVGLRHGNEATIRFIYFLDYNKLRGR